MFVSGPASLDLLLRSVLLGPLALLWIAAVVRMTGLRSFSKMTAVDFVTTVATGSLMANAATATEWHGFLQSAGAVGALLGVQALIARGRRQVPLWRQHLENEPRLLMREGEFCRPAMAAVRVTEADIYAKLREANVLDIGDVRAVVLETTGDISVLHGPRLDQELLSYARTDSAAQSP